MLRRAAITLILLCGLVARSSDALAARRAVVLLIPQDNGAYAPAAQFTEFLESAVDRNANYVLRPSGLAFGDPSPGDALALRKKLSSRASEAKKLFVGGELDEAETLFREVLRGADAAAAAFERCSEYCDAEAHVAAISLMKGDEAAAREGVRSVLAIDPSYRFEGTGFGQNFQILLKEVRTVEAREGQLGGVTIHTTPPGAKIFFDGQFKGISPLPVERVAVGKHLLRLERAGAITHGQVIAVAAGEESTVKVRLQATPEYGALEDSMDALAKEIEQRGRLGAESSKIGVKLKADRGIIGTVRTSGERRVTVTAMVVDFSSGKRLAGKVRSFEGDEYGQIEQEVRKFGNLLLAESEVARSDKPARSGGDPLDGRSGMEDWDEESSEPGAKGR